MSLIYFLSCHSVTTGATTNCTRLGCIKAKDTASYTKRLCGNASGRRGSILLSPHTVCIDRVFTARQLVMGRTASVKAAASVILLDIIRR